MIALVAGFDAYVIWRTAALQTFLVGAVVGILALIYLGVNHPLGLIWRSLPAKELAIGILFAAGTIVALLPTFPVTAEFALAALSFAALCSLNCISIAVWERDLDRSQGKVSLATRHPDIARHVVKICAGVAVVVLSFSIALRQVALIFVCVGMSVSLLAWLNKRRFFGTDERTALADLVLLTPIVVLVVSAL